MRGIGLGLGILLAVAACGRHPETAPPDAVTTSGSSGMVGALALRGQVVVAHPPGTRDAIDQLRREAAARCPDGFVIRSLRTGDAPPASEFLYHVVTYDAVVECNPPPAVPGGAR
ncbi:MAG: hypothetical protein HY060_19865 [Proteobacteria bacterium]|nr:hypothetical protein [Pseudomonadota bacterium]